jgi:hypothetical protein
MLNNPLLQRIPIPTTALLSIPSKKGIQRNIERSVIRSTDNGLPKSVIAMVEVMYGVSTVLNLPFQELLHSIPYGHLREVNKVQLRLDYLTKQ